MKYTYIQSVEDPSVELRIVNSDADVGSIIDISTGPYRGKYIVTRTVTLNRNQRRANKLNKEK